MRALVTGAGGFVGKHLIAALAEDGWETFAAGGPSDEGVDAHIDLSDLASLRDACRRAKPDVTFHLAAQSFVPQSVRAPAETYETNVIGTANVMRTVREHAAHHGKRPRVLFASSAEVYGARPAADLPLVESLAPQPRNPYAASKVAAEAILLGEMHVLGGDVVIARSFNHIGPGQSEQFAIAGFALELAKIAAGGEKILYVGNLEPERDFLDVRDVVRAYIALAKIGERGEIYNVCSGRAVKVRDVLGELIRIAGVPVEVRSDPQRLRAAETAISFGLNVKLTSRTGWSPRYTLAQSLRDIYDDARNRAGL